MITQTGSVYQTWQLFARWAVVNGDNKETLEVVSKDNAATTKPGEQ